VTGFNVGDLTVGNGTVDSLSGSGNRYTATIRPTVNHNGVVTVDILAGAAINAAGNGNTAATQLSVTADQTAPTVAIARPNGESGPVNGAFDITVTFSQAVTGFNVNDLTVGNGRASNFAGDGANYTATITPTTNYNGAVTVDIEANAATNVVNRGNRAAAQFSVIADHIAPTVLFSLTVALNASHPQ